jgi:hypothetical protein
MSLSPSEFEFFSPYNAPILHMWFHVPNLLTKLRCQTRLLTIDHTRHASIFYIL